MDDMGIFRTTLGVESPLRRGVIESLPDVLVDTGSELSWVPAEVLDRLGIVRVKQARRFQMANGGVLVRAVGYAILHAGGEETIDEVVFGEPGDLTLLGARTLEGLNLRVDVQAKQLVAAGPILAAVAA
jgi:predicted aspartyl protease